MRLVCLFRSTLRQTRLPRASSLHSQMNETTRAHDKATDQPGSVAPATAIADTYRVTGVTKAVIKILRARFWFISRVLLVSQFPPAPDFLEFLNQRGLPALHRECPCTSAMGWVIDGGPARAGPKSDSDTVAGTRQDNGGVKNSN